MTDKQITTWANNQAEEDLMNDEHAPLWRCLIERILEKPLDNKTVLDFGCNQGGFLRMLHQIRPFKKGIGVDIATHSLELANKYRATQPTEFFHATALEGMSDAFDIAFSHEVIYLLEDLEGHARQLHQALKPGGVYYAVTGCYAQMPLWEKWRDIIQAYSNIPVPNWNLEDYTAAFFKAGFRVSVQRYKLDGFIPLQQDNEYLPSVHDALDFYGNYKLIFRLEKPSVPDSVDIP